jgi:hypothetical protein
MAKRWTVAINGGDPIPCEAWLEVGDGGIYQGYQEIVRLSLPAAVVLPLGYEVHFRFGPDGGPWYAGHGLVANMQAVEGEDLCEWTISAHNTVRIPELDKFARSRRRRHA